MKKKIVGIFVLALLIATALTATGTMNFQTSWLVKENNYSQPNQNAPANSPSLITIKIVAKVKHVYDPNNLLGGAIKVNDTIKGKYTYDSNVTDSEPDPTIGYYEYNSSNFGIEFKTGRLVFETDQSNVIGLIYIGNNCSEYYNNQDLYVLVSYNNLQLSEGIEVNVIGWRLDDLTGNALSSDALPTTAPVLSDWTQSAIGLIIWGRNTSNPDDRYEIFANVTKATKSRARDVHFNMPPIIIWLLERFQNMFPILRHLMKL